MGSDPLAIGDLFQPATGVDPGLGGLVEVKNLGGPPESVG